MINVIIKNVRGEYLEFQYTAPEGVTETTDSALAYAIEQYITTKFGGFNTTIFPITQNIWNNKIKKAVEKVAEISIQDKIDILNSICRTNAFKISRILAGYSVKYPPSKLSAPEKLTIKQEDGKCVVSWEKVPNATKYKYKINDDEEQETSENSVVATINIEETQIQIQVKAVGNGMEYLDSDYVALISFPFGDDEKYN